MRFEWKSLLLGSLLAAMALLLTSAVGVTTVKKGGTGSSTNIDSVYQSIAFNNITADPNIGTTGAATAYTLAGVGSETFAAGYLDVGQTIEINAAGTFTTDGSESETLIHILTIGSKTLYTSPAVDISAASTASPWVLYCKLTMLTAGASGTAIASGFYSIDPGAAGTATTLPFTTLVSSFDTTGTNAVAVKTTWANGDASPDVSTLNQLTISVSDNA